MHDVQANDHPVIGTSVSGLKRKTSARVEDYLLTAAEIAWPRLRASDARHAANEPLLPRRSLRFGDGPTPELQDVLMTAKISSSDRAS